MASSSSRKRMAVDGLPNDCWELVLSQLLNEIDSFPFLQHLDISFPGRGKGLSVWMRIITMP
ncbi:hypothetical protein A2U01_0033561 [Trifolium medium]|uniref:Uncharacterized protein n=1 Tax=Trifolium medium TaxID=97028 RepID=A0A392PMD1_9FABA|nr:hypothetical protein [Trifolium medium]